jgi:uncharacterized protein YkwD
MESYYNDIADVLVEVDSPSSSSDILLEDVSGGDDILVSYDSGISAGDDILITNNKSSGDILLTETPAAKTNSRTAVAEAPTSDIASSNYKEKTETGSSGVTKTKSGTAAEVTNTKKETSSGDPVIDTVISEINKKRAAAGVGSVSSNAKLNSVAAKRVEEITRKFSHTRPNGRESVTILYENNVDVGRAGENIACCISSPEGVVAAWANSPSHRRCMLNDNYTQAGVGTVVSGGCTYWVLILTD